MKAIILLISFSLFVTLSKAQSYYNAYYFGNVINNTSKLTFCEGNLLMTASAKADSSITFATINRFGDIVTKKNYKLPYASIIFSEITLADSTVAVLLFNLSSDAMYFMKIDKDCNVIWAKTIVDSSGLIVANFRDIAPYGESGVVLLSSTCASTTSLIFLDGSGNIIRQNAYYGSLLLSNINIVNDGGDTFSVFSKDVSVFNGGPVFYHLDSSGAIINMIEIRDLISNTEAQIALKYLCKSTSGGHYCSISEYDSTQSHAILLFYFNNVNQLTWTKKIALNDFDISISAILPTDDNGCILVMGDYFNQHWANGGHPYLPFFMKLDSAGAIDWVKMIGDTNVVGWRYILLNDELIRNDQLVCSTFDLSSISIFSSDTALSGICYTSPPHLPTINNIYPTTLSHSCTYSHLNYLANSFPVFLQSDFSTYQNRCSGNRVSEYDEEKQFSIFPIPTDGIIQLSTNDFKNKRIQIFNSSGVEIININLYSNQQVFNLSGFPSGIYLARVQDQNSYKIIKIQLLN